MRGQPQLCARASLVNPAVNTCWPLITRAKGQEEKNRCIPELSNHFRCGCISVSLVCSKAFKHEQKRPDRRSLCVQMRHWISVEAYNCGPAERDHFRRMSGAFKIGETSLLPHQDSKKEIRHTTTMSTWSDPVTRVTGTTGLPPWCSHVYLLGSQASSSKIRTCSWSQTWRSGTGDMGQRWHGMFTWRGGKDLVIYTTMHHLLQQMGHSALTESC